jgi:hypothetical protein
MRRWIFAVLVLVNIGLFMWASWYRVEPGITVAPRPLFHPELMVPLNTPGVALKSRRTERPPAPLVAAKAPERCIRIGPLPAEVVESATRWLADEKFAATPHREERRVENSYWLHLGPFENREEAETRLKLLVEKGVKDVLIMQDAQGEPAISLGLYNRIENANLRLQELAGKGVEARQEIRYRNETLTWFELRLSEPADAGLARLRGHDWGARGVEVNANSCPAEADG